jgi:hypothetical protein
VIGTIANHFKRTFENVKTTLKGVWDGIVGVFKAPINKILGYINKLIDGWNSLKFNIPKVDLGVLGSYGGISIGVPHINNISYLAKGGIVDQPTLSMIGESGKEAVVPLENNTGWMSSLAESLTSSMNMSEVVSLLKDILSYIQEGKILAVDSSVLAKVVSKSLSSNFRTAGYTTVEL